ncbi:tetratricopeptide repeat protein [Cylindrospermum stagnale PCC 7417]|uniref:Tetratricopeptide repeat protein n=1 Tax=Cylindrospermum stagnale PCC 7417 TaxID=56107 RepID=K9WUP9_9NOST|nr:tetratricopeptide repeat protein [Cylindrospermum stagnale PCC 7417]
MAIADFNQTLRIDPQSVDAYYNRGLAYFKQRNPQAAIKDFNQAIRINRNLADAYGNRGLAQYTLGDQTSAIADLEQAARLFRQQGNTQSYQQTQTLIQQVRQ